MEDLLEWGVACLEVASNPTNRLKPSHKTRQPAAPNLSHRLQTVIGTVPQPPKPSVSVNLAPIVMIAVRQKYLLPDGLHRCAKRVLPRLPPDRGGGAELGRAAEQPSQAQRNQPGRCAGAHTANRRIPSISFSPASISRFNANGFSPLFSATSRRFVSAVTSPLSNTRASGVRGVP